ncbi:MAG: hypothetical protein OH315_03970 [Candidatus Parvarchaeota archaeon]|nr:hypothetical protein [Candidatus Rehaiarchaeum fermentans]
MDTLALDTSAVAYDIFAIRFVYQGLKTVKVEGLMFLQLLKLLIGL